VNTYDALHDAAGSALRAWMDTRRDTIQAETGAVRILFLPGSGGLLVVGDTRPVSQAIRGSRLGFVWTGDGDPRWERQNVPPRVWVQEAATDKTSPQGFVLLAVRGDFRVERGIKGGYNADTLVSTGDTVVSIANRLRRVLEEAGATVRLSPNLRETAAVPKLGDWLAGFYERNPRFAGLSRRVQVFKRENAPREVGKKPPIILEPEFWTLPTPEQDAAFAQELLRRFPSLP
jgi:hypothetical protein